MSLNWTIKSDLSNKIDKAPQLSPVSPENMISVTAGGLAVKNTDSDADTIYERGKGEIGIY